MQPTTQELEKLGNGQLELLEEDLYYTINRIEAILKYRKFCGSDK